MQDLMINLGFFGWGKFGSSGENAEKEREAVEKNERNWKRQNDVFITFRVSLISFFVKICCSSRK